MVLLDLLGRRWALRILWELRDGPLAFRALQASCEGMSSSVLTQRLSELCGAEILERHDGAYRLSGEGARLLESLAELNDWADRWAERSREA
jgi:DNA-binding HxlR family transcriptional regulator